MNLKQHLIDFGCGPEFVEIAMSYAQFYQPDQDLETFIEYVEETHAKVEEAEAFKAMDQEIVDASGLFEAFENGEKE